MLCSCKLGPGFPDWLRTQMDFLLVLEYLDISASGISYSLPYWFWDPFQRLSFRSLTALNLGDNSFSGSLSSSLGSLTSLEMLSLRVMGLVVTIISTFQGDRPIYVPVGEKDVATVRVEATNSTATVRPEGFAQGGYIFHSTDVSCILHPCANVDVEPHVGTNADVSTATNASTHAAIDGDVNTGYLFDIFDI
ncbi:hypothetical protein Gotur_018840 [Gossypium turneri]